MGGALGDSNNVDFYLYTLARRRPLNARFWCWIANAGDYSCSPRSIRIERYSIIDSLRFFLRLENVRLEDNIDSFFFNFFVHLETCLNQFQEVYEYRGDKIEKTEFSHVLLYLGDKIWKIK